jgi:hypothetical protein
LWFNRDRAGDFYDGEFEPRATEKMRNTKRAEQDVKNVGEIPPND